METNKPKMNTPAVGTLILCDHALHMNGVIELMPVHGLGIGGVGLKDEQRHRPGFVLCRAVKDGAALFSNVDWVVSFWKDKGICVYVPEDLWELRPLLGLEVTKVNAASVEAIPIYVDDPVEILRDMAKTGELIIKDENGENNTFKLTVIQTWQKIMGH